MEYLGLYIFIVTFIPILGGLIAYRVPVEKSLLVNAAFVSLAFIGSIGLIGMVGEQPFVMSRQWVDQYTLQISIDRLSVLLIILVNFISLLVFLFSNNYMRGEKGLHRYGLKLSFFTASMIGLLVSDSFILLFLFWELVGFSSFLLISFWYEDKSKAQAAKESFMINRVADAFLLTGILLLMSAGHQSISGLNEPIGFWTGSFLMLGAFGKSAQLPFSGWLPKAMAGPTPVSALIHAATMVTAGVYLLIRLAPVLPEPLKFVIALVGAITAFYAAFSALTQYDIKGVLAYSTISQLGYMMIGIGVGVTTSAAFHLWTHAFFKAGLFMSAGSVITYMHHAHGHQYDPQDMRNMGSLKRFLPITFTVHSIFSLALAGVPFFSGFMSKGGIIAGASQWALNYGTMGIIWAYLVPVLAFLTAFLTPIYIFRQIYLVYFGETKLPIWITGFKQSNWIKVPIIVLAGLSFWFFFGLNPLSENWYFGEYALSQYPDMSIFKNISILSEVITTLLVAGGVWLVYLIYWKGNRMPSGDERNFFRDFSYRGWYLSIGYDVINISFIKICKFFAFVDEKVVDHALDLFGVTMVMISRSIGWIDRFIVDGVIGFSAKLASSMSVVLSRLQSRGIQSQILYLLILFISIIIWMLLI